MLPRPNGPGYIPGPVSLGQGLIVSARRETDRRCPCGVPAGDSPNSLGRFPEQACLPHWTDTTLEGEPACLHPSIAATFTLEAAQKFHIDYEISAFHAGFRWLIKHHTLAAGPRASRLGRASE